MLIHVNEATNFIVRQNAARRSTHCMVFLFGLGVITTICVIYAIIALLMGGPDPEVLFWVVVLVGGSILLATIFKIYELSDGGKTIALALGGCAIRANPTDIDEKKLRNVVEEVAIASGIPVPEIYVLDQEQSINAFAAGHSPADAAIGVTQGAIRNLNREELQGVVAHEFSHILNGDMKLNIRLISLIFGLLFLTVIGRFLLYAQPSSDRNGKGTRLGIILLALLLIVIGWISVFFGKVIQSAISRQREYLADASAVQFTRNPMGLAAALKKIGILSQHSYIASPEAEETAHLFFAQGLKGFWNNIFATHPPLIKRIKLLDPSFDGTFPKHLLKSQSSSTKASSKPQDKKQAQSPLRSGMRKTIPAIAALGAGYTSTEEAHSVLENLSRELRVMTEDPLGAITLIYGTLLDQEEDVLQIQINGISRGFGKHLAKNVLELKDKLIGLPRSQKIALASLCTASLRLMSEEQFKVFNRVLKKLVRANDETDIFEYCILKNIEHNLKNYFSPKSRRRRKASTSDLKKEITVMLSVLSRAEAADDEEAAKAFRIGLEKLQGEKAASLSHDIQLLPSEDCSFELLDDALEQLTKGTNPATKQSILDACKAVVAATNDHVTENEGNLIRAIALVLDL